MVDEMKHKTGSHIYLAIWLAHPALNKLRGAPLTYTDLKIIEHRFEKYMHL